MYISFLTNDFFIVTVADGQDELDELYLAFEQKWFLFLISTN